MLGPVKFLLLSQSLRPKGWSALIDHVSALEPITEAREMKCSANPLD